MDITIEDILNTTESFHELERQIYQLSRQQLAEKIAFELNTPLPNLDADGYKKVLADRHALLQALQVHNNLLTENKPLEVQEWDDIEVQPREWLIPDWLPANTCTLFTGQGGTGKSWFTLQLICQLTGGFIDWAALHPHVSTDANATEPATIVLATYEDEPAEIKRRIQSLASGMNWIQETLQTIKQYLHIVDMRGVGSVWGPGMGNHIANTGALLPSGYQLQHICEDKDAKLLIIDPLSGAFGGNENDRTAVYDFISSFRRWGDTAKCAVLVVGHLPKYAEGKNAGFSGSTAWEASVRSMWLLSKEDNGGGGKNDPKEYYYALSHTKSNYAQLQSEIPLIKSQYGWWKQADNNDDAVEGYNAYHNAKQEDTHDDNPYENS